MQILILGMHRSGTSATARLVNMLGAYFAPESIALGAKPENPKGFWERRDVLYVNKELLRTQKCNWEKLSKWQPEKASFMPEELQQPVRAILDNLNEYIPWFIKDPRLCLTLPAWLMHLQFPVALFVHRDPHEIAISLQKRNGFELSYGIAMWEFYMASALNNSLHIPRIFVRHQDMLKDPVSFCESMLQAFKTEGDEALSMPDHAAITDFIDPALYRSIPTDTSITLSPEQQYLCDILQGKEKQDAPLSITTATQSLIREHT